MKPVKIEERVTYGIEFYATAEQADTRGDVVANAPRTRAHLVVDVGRAPLFDRHDYTTHAPLFAVVVP